MSRTTTFFEFSETTKDKWQDLAKQCALLADLQARGDADYTWTKDEILEHIIEVYRLEENEIDEHRMAMYFERMRMASVYNGTSDPTLDLVYDAEDGFCYKWLRNNELPFGFLSHILGVASGMPRLAFDYFTLLAKEYQITDLIEAIGAKKAMTLMLLAETYVRIHKAKELDDDHFQTYIGLIGEFKNDIQKIITREEAEQFNSMMGALLLSGLEEDIK